MRPMLTYFALLLVTACAGYHGAIVTNSNVVGPHGERLFELQCQEASGCMSEARYLCAGDFNVVTSGKGGMLVGCTMPQDAGGVLPRADAGL